MKNLFFVLSVYAWTARAAQIQTTLTPVISDQALMFRLEYKKGNETKTPGSDLNDWVYDDAEAAALNKKAESLRVGAELTLGASLLLVLVGAANLEDGRGWDNPFGTPVHEPANAGAGIGCMVGAAAGVLITAALFYQSSVYEKRSIDAYNRNQGGVYLAPGPNSLNIGWVKRF